MELRTRFKLYLVLACVGVLGVSELYLSLDFRVSDLLPKKEVGLWEYQPTFDDSYTVNHAGIWAEDWSHWKHVVPREKWKDSIDVELGYFPPTKDLFGLLIFSSGKRVYLEKVLFGDGLATISIPTVASQVDIYFIKRLSILDATDLSWEELQQSELVYKHDRVILDMDREPAKIDCSPYGDLEVWYWKGKKAQ